MEGNILREIKFRAWMEDEMLSHDDLVNMDQETHAMYSILTEPQEDITFMQYTGLKDKNGVEIYEGDIVRFVDFDSSGGHREDRVFTGVIKYQSGPYEIWKNNDSEFFEADGAFILNHAWLQDDEFEIIGNIYENPELLEETK